MSLTNHQVPSAHSQGPSSQVPPPPGAVPVVNGQPPTGGAGPQHRHSSGGYSQGGGQNRYQGYQQSGYRGPNPGQPNHYSQPTGDGHGGSRSSGQHPPPKYPHQPQFSGSQPSSAQRSYRHSINAPQTSAPVTPLTGNRQSFVHSSSSSSSTRMYMHPPPSSASTSSTQVGGIPPKRPRMDPNPPGPQQKQSYPQGNFNRQQPWSKPPNAASSSQYRNAPPPAGASGPQDTKPPNFKPIQPGAKQPIFKPIDPNAQLKPALRPEVKTEVPMTRPDMPGTPFADPKREPKEEMKGRPIIGKICASPALLSYIDTFQFPYLNDVTNYEKILKIGQGTFGEVFKARCKTTGKLVALKKILMENEKEGFPITALREVKMLQKLKHRHITELLEICGSKAKNEKARCTFYLVFTFCDHDLAGLLSHRSATLTLQHVKTLVKHLLEGLYHIHANNILHRDMKAANVLITHEGVLKLADFGLARPIYKNRDPCYTNRVVTLWYRPPELLLGTRQYGPAIDMWGAGCIMAELWTRSPILQGDTEQKQLGLISHLCGSITTANWPSVDKLPLYGQIELPQNLQRRVRERLVSYVKSEEGLNMIDELLTLDPEKRPDAEKMLDHRFLFEEPMPKENVADLLKTLPNNMFEYTAGRGAHANRGRQHNAGHRPQRPAANAANTSHLGGFVDRLY
ncbi:CMGC/CDK/CDK9 protein kinase [Aphelenchoides avenae]|nr:CMGC/CDK/CDK9 protein kinase [Aphelenchus avenae]